MVQNGLYASMWNRQREAEAAREKLALAGEEMWRRTAIRRWSRTKSTLPPILRLRAPPVDAVE